MTRDDSTDISNPEERIKEYHTDDLIVYWWPKRCSHAGKCWGALPEVFDIDKQPWITLANAGTEEIIKAIDRCPSDALKYKVKPGAPVDPSLTKGPGSVDHQVVPAEFITIRMVKNGPLLVKGAAKIMDADGKLIKESNHIVLCACGKSDNKPFCDGSHARK
ncbi:MAG: (4Fe-4S)-binding protein [Syntrophomonadaceae bacterium]